MKARILLPAVLLLCLVMIAPVEAKQAMKRKFPNPVKLFEGLWQVDSYDWREFDAVPKDIDKQLYERSEALPVGQRLRFVSEGVYVMPGTIDPSTMKSDGPTGETFEMTLLRPFPKALCERDKWEYVCEPPVKDEKLEVMITEIWRVDDPAGKYKAIWPELVLVKYSFVSLARHHLFNVMLTKNGDMIIPILVDGPAKKEGRTNGMLGIRLKRIKE